MTTSLSEPIKMSQLTHGTSAVRYTHREDDRPEISLGVALDQDIRWDVSGRP